MQDIDFLPAELKRRRTNRHGRAWRIAVAVAAVGLTAAVAVTQARTRQQIKARLAAIEPMRNILDAQQAQLSQLEDQLAQQEARAELVTYFSHPWPRTRLLASALRELPAPIVCDRIHIARETQSGRAARRRGGDAESDELAALEPATRDLRRLREELDSVHTVIALEGTTSDGIALHRYLDRLNDVPLLDRVELRSLEAIDDKGSERFRFAARIVTSPGFGQPNGPQGPAEQLAGSASAAPVSESTRP